MANSMLSVLGQDPVGEKPKTKPAGKAKVKVIKEGSKKKTGNRQFEETTSVSRYEKTTTNFLGLLHHLHFGQEVACKAKRGRQTGCRQAIY